MPNKNIEAAIESRLTKALDEDLSHEEIDQLEKKITAVRKLAPAGDE